MNRESERRKRCYGNIARVINYFRRTAASITKRLLRKYGKDIDVGVVKIA